MKIEISSQDLYDIETYLLHHGRKTLPIEVREILEKLTKQRYCEIT